jgi:hypothetical protein
MSKLDSVLISLRMLEDPRLIELPRDVRYMHIEALAWAGEHKTDGAISRAALRRLTDQGDAALAAASLVSAGLWRSTDAGWEIVGYLDSQISAQDAERITDANALRNRRYRQHRLGDHSLCERCPAVRANASRDASSNASRDDSRLDSTRRLSPSGEEEAREAASSPVALGAPSTPYREAGPPTEAGYGTESLEEEGASIAWESAPFGTNYLREQRRLERMRERERAEA